ncbi:FTR1 family iron permease [Alloscardovia theropitheci]|uniref:FTR1 family iron permease n=1 Tax=Alloscardovia theropitheci TaxID=2496842 RepID=A0A4R0QPM0_9BIFI|nr:FTR1 family protein [Alloscardovia theropitheci]TCD54182.1 FTR1 family iron permease [Alloscardovia theropitheci]
MRSWVSKLVMSFMLLAVVVIALFSQFAPLSIADTNGSDNAATSSSSIAQSADVDSWSVVASNIVEDLQNGVNALNNSDTTSASSYFQRAYNVEYVASNMIVVAGQYAQTSAQAGEQVRTVQAELQAFTTDVFVSSKVSTIPSRVESIEPALNDVATQLDNSSSIQNPRDFAQARAEKTAQERKKLDAAKVRKNEGRGNRTWSDVALEMSGILDRAQTAATTGNNDREGSDLVNNAYYQYYEKLGFEKTVMSAISGARVSEVENQFKETRKSMIGGKSDAVVEQNVAVLKKMLVDDAKKLDDGAAAKINPFVSFVTSSFGQAFVILLREGLEAILVIAAIIAYLVKAGQRKSIKFIYVGSALGIVASAIMAALLILVFQAAGSHQEVFEGVTALIAMVMLLYTSNWMLSKSSNESWSAFVDEKTRKSISNGSVFSLALLAFLAVFREGAETVIFYQALMAMNSDGDYSPIAWGAVAAAVALVAIFLLFRFTSVKIPYKQFFAVMSVILSIMVVIFAGSGLHELIEADVFDGIYLSGWPTNDFLGIYPYVQTIVFQIIMAIIVVALYVVSAVRRKQLSARNTVNDKATTAARDGVEDTFTNEITDETHTSASTEV